MVGNGLDTILPTLTWSIILLGACVVLLVSVGLYLFVYRRRKMAAEEREEDAEEAVTEEGDGSYLGPFLDGPVLLVLLDVIAEPLVVEEPDMHFFRAAAITCGRKQKKRRGRK